MPDRSKVRWSQLKVGIVGLAAFAILAVLIFLLTGATGVFEKMAHLRTYMDDASGIPDGATVRLNGITIGSLSKLVLTNSRDPRRVVEFDMQIRARYLAEIPIDSVAGISAANLLGDKFINITKGMDTKHVEDGSELKSLSAQDIPELLKQATLVFDSLQSVVVRVDNLLKGVEQGKGNIGLLLSDTALYDRLTGIGKEMEGLLADVRHGKGTISKMLYDDGLYNDFRAPIKRIDAILADLQAGQGTAGKLLKDPALFDEAKQTVDEMKRLMADVNAGKGTAGKLLKDDQLARRMDELMAKLNGTIDKISSGQGTLGQFMVNPQLYESINGATREFQSLAKDIRANPKKFLTIRLMLF
ncbi:MAG TPA: MlaD family protein [Candidatus Acidoferrales bacterium]|nr:MlaD family protein [Candidatus Acidoferrales bacterium]